MISRLSPLASLSLGLVALTVSVMLMGDLLVDLTPEQNKEALEYRRILSESLAVQYSKLAERSDSLTIKFAMLQLVERNDDILSAALQLADGGILVQAGSHQSHWVQPNANQSTFDHVQVPIFNGDTLWATLQVSFRPLHDSSAWAFFTNPWLQFVLFVGVSGFLGYLFFMKRTLKQLDPSSVVPGRVKAALDVLTEGVVLLDPKGFIVLVNEAFCRFVGEDLASLTGKTLSEIPWEYPGRPESFDLYPWTQVRKTSQPDIATKLNFINPQAIEFKFIVNSSPILDDKNRLRGVLISFLDVTELERTNDYLNEVVGRLEKSQEEVQHQNEELQMLATRDPLTGILNRRSFFQKGEAVLSEAAESGDEVCCIMGDIDYFKSFNDQYGHAVGDQVIQVVAKTFSTVVRPTDFVGRYGGEEFCVLLPKVDIEAAAEIAERIRIKVEAECGLGVRSVEGLQIRSSFGVSSSRSGATTTLELVDQADKALYAAKEGGRNCVMCLEPVAAGMADADLFMPQARRFTPR